MKLKVNDILMFYGGDLACVMEEDCGGMVRILCAEDDEQKFYDKSVCKNNAENLGQDPYIRALFHATRSIHVRLNRMAKV